MQEIPSIAKLKKQAKQNKKISGLKLSQEQQKIAKQLGYTSWESLLKKHPQETKICLSLETALPVEGLDNFDGLGYPNFELQWNGCNLGIICGEAGTGKTVLLVTLLERLVKQGHNITIIDACTYGMESLVAQKEAGAPYHDLGSIMNSRLLMLYPEQVKSITVGDSFPSASPNEIVVVDDCLYQYANERRNTELKMELEKYVLAGGITLLSLQNISELTDLIKLHENVKPDHIEKMVGFVLDKSRANLTDLAKHEPFKSNPAILNLNSRRGNGSWLIASYPGTEQEIMSIGVSPYFDPEAIHNFLNEIC